MPTISLGDLFVVVSALLTLSSYVVAIGGLTYMLTLVVLSDPTMTACLVAFEILNTLVTLSVCIFRAIV